MKNLLIAASAIALVAGCASDHDVTYRGTTGSMGAGTDAGYGIGVAATQQGAGAVQLTSSQLSADEVNFLKRAAEYNQADIQLGQAIVQHSESPAVKTFGQRLADDHTLANHQLMAIVAQTGVTVPTIPNQEQQRMLDRLNGLNGNQFDDTAIHDSIEMQERQVALDTQASNNLSDSQVKNYARQNLSLVQDELTRARTLNGPAPTSTPLPQQ